MVRIAMVGLVLMLAGCAKPPHDDALFPLVDDRRWTYRITIQHDEPPDLHREELTLRTRGQGLIDGEVAWRRRSHTGMDYWLRSDDSGIYRVATKSDIDAQPRLDSPRRFVLRKPYVVGTEWEASTTAYVLQRRNEFPQTQYQRNRTLAMRYRIDAIGERVETPAGVFGGCLRVVGRAELRIFVDAMGSWRDSPVTTREWYCPGVGLARLERLEPSASKLLNGGTLTMELVSWK